MSYKFVSTRFLIAVTVVACTALLPVCAHAVIVELQDGKRVVGFLVSESEDKIVVRTTAEDGTGQTAEYARDKIKTLLKTVKTERLSQLDGKTARAYREYAEELAEKQIDPDARRAALRLFLIAAFLEPDKHGRGSLLAMSQLAVGDAQRRRFRQMAFLLDPSHDPQLLDSTEPKKSDPTKKLLLRCIQAFRQGSLREALTLAKRRPVREAFTPLGPISYDDFIARCEKNLPKGSRAARKNVELQLTDEELEAILSRELQLSENGTSSASGNSWSTILRRGGTRPVRPLSLETLTEFDPRKSLYRDGEWIVSSEK